MSAEDLTPEERIDRYLLGQATEEDVEILNTLLVEDERLRKIYRFRVALEGGYREAVIRNENAEASVGVSPSKAELRPVSRKSSFFGFAAVTVSLAAIALVAVSSWSDADQGTPLAGGPAPSKASVARLVASIDADWREVEPEPGALLEPGTFLLDTGTIELEFNRGARVTLQGPSQFELKNSDLLHVSSGTLIARIPEEAIGFTITTDQAEVVDLGTEFGLSVGEDGQTDVHVLDGLVEVLPRNGEGDAAGVMISEGQARRFQVRHDASSAEIPVRSREALLGDQRYHSLGVRMLRGSVRMTDRLGLEDYAANTEGRHWINLIAEQKNVILDKPVEVALDTPGRTRSFNTSGKTVSVGTRVNSYLLHFRPTSKKDVRGVIRFEQPVLGVLCTPKQLESSDQIFGVSSIEYPTEAAPRGLEPGPYFDAYVEKFGMPSDFQPDEVILSQDRSTLSIKASADPDNGYYDQVRILTLAPE